jgi:hypothetical protein
MSLSRLWPPVFLAQVVGAGTAWAGRALALKLLKREAALASSATQMRPCMAKLGSAVRRGTNCSRPFVPFSKADSGSAGKQTWVVLRSRTGLMAGMRQFHFPCGVIRDPTVQRCTSVARRRPVFRRGQTISRYRIIEKLGAGVWVSSIKPRTPSCSALGFDRSWALLQFCVLRFGLLQDRDIRVGIFP